MAANRLAHGCVSKIAIVAAFLATPAAAQESTPSPQAETASRQADNLGDIVVTAQRREQSLQRVPMSISALGADTLRDAGGFGVSKVAALVPSLSLVANNAPIAQSYRLRGLGSDPNIPTFEPSVALFIDGVYMPRSGLGVDDLVDVARVEVLKGPQSTLYGKNATAGVISIVSERPSRVFTGSLEGSVSWIEGGRTPLAFRTAGSLSGPISDHIRFRLTGVGYHQGATFRNLTGREQPNEMKRYAVRGQIEIDLSDAVTLNVTAARSKVPLSNNTDSDVYLGTPSDVSYALDNNPALNALFGVTSCPDNDPTNRVICTTSPTRSSSRSDMASGTLTAETGFGTFTSITAWSRYKSLILQDDVDQVSIPIIAFRDAQKGRTISQEVRLVSPTGSTFEWLVGGYYLGNNFERGERGKVPMFVLGPAAALLPLSPALPSQVVFGQSGDSGYEDARADSDYFAIFGQTTYHFSPLFSLTGGLRWQTEKKTASLFNSATFTPNPNLPANSPLAGLNIITANLAPAVSFPDGVPINGALPDLKYSNATWMATANVTPNADTLFYATYAHGSKSGGYNVGFGPALPAVRGFSPEKVDNFELGSKLTLADRRVRLAASVFHSRYADYQNAGFVGAQFLVNNAEKVTVTGAEAEGTFRLASGLTSTLGGAYIKSRFKKYTGGACYFGRAPDANPDASGAFTSCDLSGKQLPFAPKWRITAGLQYEHPVPMGALYLRADSNWQSATNTNSANLDPRNVQQDYVLVNTRVGVRLDTGLDVSFWATNLTNKTYVVQATGLNLFAASTGYVNYLGAPRQVGATARLRF